MKVSTEIDNNFGYEKITLLVDSIPLTNLSKEKYVKVNLQIKTVCFVPPSNEKREILPD
jgi:hypothetical protein